MSNRIQESARQWSEQNDRGRQLAAGLAQRLRNAGSLPAFAANAARLMSDEPEGVRVGFWFAMASELR